MEYRYLRCPYCGQSDGHDDKIVSSEVVDKSYNGGELVLVEGRKCDICQKVYPVEMHYALRYERFAE